MSVGLGRSQLDSRGGVVGGTIDVNTLEMVGKLESLLLLACASVSKGDITGKTDFHLFNSVFLYCFGSLSAHISEHPNQQPSHKIEITMGSTEARVDYMGSSILMGIFSNADLKLQDEWKINLYNNLDSSMTDKR